MTSQNATDFLLSKHSGVPSPCFVLDMERLVENARILDSVQKASGAKILLALKAFSAWSIFPLLSRAFSGPLWGTCASSVDEARLGKEAFGGEVHAFAPAWTFAEIEELLGLADHIVFNSLRQWHKFRPIIEHANNTSRKSDPVKCGLRVNPEHSEGAVAIYNPCFPGSRLGIRSDALKCATEADLAGISGLHFHSLCEQNSDALARTLAAFEQKFKNNISDCSWLNFGGGHHITRKDYNLELLISTLLDWQKRYGTQIYIEPGEAIALNAGWLSATVLDIVEADMPVAILDVSASCHMPDVLEMPYTPEVFYTGKDGSAQKAAGAGQNVFTCRLGGKSCLAGDVISEYSFDRPLAEGDRLIFADMAIYSMVKTTTFNGLRLPSIGLLERDATGHPHFKLIREFSYSDFKNRLS